MKILQLPISLNKLNHELRSSMTVILAITNFLNTHATHHEQEFYVKELQTSIYALLSFIDKILSLAKEIDVSQSYTHNVTPPSNSTVLLVEDTPIIQVFHKKVLENLGLGIELAESGEQALDKLNTTVYSLIFLDIGLPGINGIETAAKIRQLAAPKKDIPIIALTAFADKKTQLACLDAGINIVETKPIRPEKLSELVAYFL